jgi:hypothetical protein
LTNDVILPMNSKPLIQNQKADDSLGRTGQFRWYGGFVV